MADRELIRHRALRTAARLGSGPAVALELALRATRLPSGVALVYHRLGQRAGDPDRDLVPALEIHLFERQLAHLRRHYRLVLASDLLEAAAERSRGAPFPVAITFDDDLSSHARYAAPALNRAGAPATFFLSGASLEGSHRFWWEDLGALFDRGAFDGEARRAVAAAGALSPEAGMSDIREVGRLIEELAPVRRDAVASTLRELVGAHPVRPALSRRDLLELRESGFEIGFHTLRHYALPTLADDALVASLDEGRARLEAVGERPIDILSYPHGAAGPREAEAARLAGYQLAFAGAARHPLPRSGPRLIGRVDPSIRSLGAFAAQVALALVGRSTSRSR